MEEVLTMKPDRKKYACPELVVHGDLRKITRRGGGNHTDVPEGTVVTSIADITS